jgi:hypothetical protein
VALRATESVWRTRRPSVSPNAVFRTRALVSSDRSTEPFIMTAQLLSLLQSDKDLPATSTVRIVRE